MSTPLPTIGGVPAGIQRSGGSPTAPTQFTGTTTTPDAGSVSIEAALESLALFEAQFEGIRIVGAMLNSDYDPNGTLYDTIDVQWEIIGRPGVFTTSVPFAINWTAIAFFYIGEDANKVELIYEGAASLAEVPTVFLTQPPPSNPPTPIPRPGQPVYV